MNEIKKSVRGAATSSLLVVIFLIVMATDADKVTSTSVIMGITTFVMACIVVTQWIKCVRKYVDFVIKQKMEEVVTGK